MLRAAMTDDAPLRVAIVAPYDLSAAGGINNQIRGQARALRQLGHAVEVFGPASGAIEDGERRLGRTLTVTIGGTESGLGVDPRAFCAVGRMVRRRFDVVHVHEPLTPLAPWIAVMRSRAPVVGTFHVHREHHGLYGAWSWALQPLARRIRARIAVSEAARRTVAPHFPGEYVIVPNGIEGERFRTTRPRPAAFAADRPHVLYVGRLEPRKGVEHLVRAMAQVQQRVPAASLVIVGDGSGRGGLARVAREVGASVRFAGRIADDDLPAYFQAADLVCSPALGGESFGIVLLEAMASGRPVVASRIEGYEALVGAANAAVLVPPGDAAALAAELVTLLESPERRRVLAANGAALARAYEWQTLAPRLEAIYRSLVHESRERD
jgi:phosphatidyl-myo-inositol alpha-mannosyltransferase